MPRLAAVGALRAVTRSMATRGLIAGLVDMSIAAPVTVDAATSHGKVFTDFLAGDRVSRLGGRRGSMGRLSGSRRRSCRSSADDGGVGFNEVLQVGNYLVPGHVLLLWQS